MTMGDSLEADYFPRGGKRAPVKPEKRQHDPNLFAISKPASKRVRKEKTLPNQTITDSSFQHSLKLQGTLNYSKLQEGMLVLGCIRQITSMSIQVELPGLTYVQVAINNISDSFTDNLAKSLQEESIDKESVSVNDILHVGQLVVVKILSLETSSEKVQGSLNPRDVNSERNHNSFAQDLPIWASVVQELDHGYELSVGVRNCRVFLPFKHADQKYSIGQPVFCVAQKVVESDTTSTLTVSAKKADFEQQQQIDDTPSLKDILPGAQVEFVVEEATPHGIKGTFFDTYFAYIDRTHFFAKMNFQQAWPGKVFTARVLFIEPLTKVTYLTMREFDILPEPQHEIGAIVRTEVVSYFGKGLLVKLGQNLGFVSNKRLLNSLPKHDDLTEAVARKFAPGSKHQCRILDYSRMECVYICTFETNILKEKVFALKDLHLGQNVKVKIKAVVEKGLVVLAGNVQGFIPNMQLINGKYSEAIKQRYNPGMTLEARVLNIDGNNVLFTIKPDLVQSENCLSSPENFDSKLQYPGFVTLTKLSGTHVVFYGGVTGWLPTREINRGNSKQSLDPRQYYFPGQIVNVWVLKTTENGLLLTLKPPESRKSSIDIGEMGSGKITRICENGLDIEFGGSKINGFLPTSHLSLNAVLCGLLKDTFKVGDVLEPIICVQNKSPPILSYREAILKKAKCFKILPMAKIRPNSLLSCSFDKASKSGIYVYTTIKDHRKLVFIPNPDNGESFPQYVKHEWILTQVTQCDNATLQLKVVPCDSNLIKNGQMMMLSQNVQDVNAIIKHNRKLNSPITQYQIGERVHCMIKNRTEGGGCKVLLPNKVVGLVPSHLAPNKYKLKTNVECVVLHYDFEQNNVVLCFANYIKDRINPTQNGIISIPMFKSVWSQILLPTKFYTVAALRDRKSNRQLVYIPNGQDWELLDKVKVSVHKKIGDWLVGCSGKGRKQFEDPEITAKDEKQAKNQKAENLEEAKSKKRKKTSNNTDIDVKKLKIDETITVKDESDDEKFDVDDIKIEIKEEIEEQFEQENISEDQKEVDEELVDIKEEEEIKEESSEDSTEEEEDVAVEKDSNQSTKKKRLGKAERMKSSIKNKPTLESIEPGHPLLSGMSSFYSEPVDIKEESSSSDEETAIEEDTKKKKLTKAERAELARMEEERVHKIETELANAETPQTPDQFDRALLANPNHSELWLRYIAMHVATTELDKARAIAKRALDTINISQIKEKFNIWVALLNLENMYGTPETFESTFQQAVKFNDSLEIYLTVIKMLAESGKINEMEEKVRKVRNKEKQNSKMWLDVGQVYYSLGKFREARNIKEAALKSISDKKRQFDLIVKFGIMEFQSGEMEQAIANFETMIETFPAKILIWFIYVDQLVKKKKIEEARNVLQRASGQKFNMKSMKAIFQKFIHFEEQHGTPATVEAVKKQVAEYVSSVK